MKPGKKEARRLAASAVAVLVLIQFLPVDRANPPVVHDLAAPEPVSAILRQACYDCHSRETRWPWYSRVAPASWVIAHHIDEARRELDFSDWPILEFSEQDELLRNIAKEVDEGRMPLASYRLIHAEARLSDAQRAAIHAWAVVGSGESGMEKGR